MTNYTYYIPSQGVFGNPEVGERLKRIYQNTGLSITHCGKLNGVSTWTREDGTEVVRLIALDFFNGEKSCYVVKDLI